MAEYSYADLKKAFIAADAAGDAESARMFAERLVQMQQPSAPEYAPPTEGMSGMEQFMAGAGGAMTRRAMGLGQALGMVSPQQIEEQQRLSAPLMQQGPAKAGAIAGDIASVLPAALIPGAATIPGAMAIGAGTEALTTPGGLGERATAGALGGALSGAGQLGARAISGGMGGLGALMEPFTPSGREAIASRTMQRFATDPQAALQSLQNVPQYVPGSIPTTAEATGDIGLAQLQRTILSTPELQTSLPTRMQANRSARYEALSSIAKNPAELDAAIKFRAAITEPMYEKAFAAPINVPDVKASELMGIIGTPSGRQAVNAAQQLAEEEGVDISADLSRLMAEGSAAGTISPRALQYIKWGYDDLLDRKTGETALGKKAAELAKANRAKLVNWIEEVNPAQAKADKAFSKLSRPIDQMKVGEYIMNKYASALSQESGVGETATEFMRAVRGAPDLISQRATGFKKPLEQILNPKQMKLIDGIAKDLARKARAENVGLPKGSATAQNLSAQNLLRRTIGPIGFPQNFAEETLMPSLMTAARVPQFAYNAMAEPKLQGLLGEAMLQPDVARRLLEPRLPSLYQRAAAGIGNAPVYPLVGGALGQRENGGL